MQQRRLEALAWVVPVGFGLWLRGAGLPDQVLVGDEQWEIVAALSRSWPGLFGTLQIQNAAYSPLVAAWQRLLIDLGTGPGELALRAPSWLSGIALLVGLPLVARRWLGPGLAYVWLCLLATSPLLVLYARVSRGYMLLVLLCAIATICAVRLAERGVGDVSGGRTAVLTYGLAAGLAVQTHLLALPFVIAPILYAGARAAMVPGATGLARRDLVAWAGATLVIVALCLAPAAPSIAAMLGSKGAIGRIDLAAVQGALSRLAGLGPVSAVVFFVLAAIGAWRLSARRPQLAAIVVAQIVLQLVLVLALRPVGIARDVILARYLLVSVPWLLLLVAAGIAPRRDTPPRAACTWIALVAVCATVATAGPLVRSLHDGGSFANALVFRSWDEGPPTSSMLESEAFYASLADDPERAGVVLETLWHGAVFADTAPAHQRVHRQPVVVSGSIDAWWNDPRLGLRNMLHVEGSRTDAYLGSRARWLVVHVDPLEEAVAIRGHDLAWFESVMPRPYRELARREVALSAELAAMLRRRFGPPDHADRWIEVWDLERLRARR